ncbi:unnamed protein product, partial [Choristocarpus tenellus]
QGVHVEDIDCSLIVRPTRTALDLTFFDEGVYLPPPIMPPLASLSLSLSLSLTCFVLSYYQYIYIYRSPTVSKLLMLTCKRR